MHRLYFLLLILFSLSACTMNSHFSCNATAGDTCLTIEEVDAMTHFADDKAPRKKTKRLRNKAFIQGYLTQSQKGQAIWLAQNLGKHSWS